MTSRLIGLLLTLIVALPINCQTSPAYPPAQTDAGKAAEAASLPVPNHVLYELFFRRVAGYEDLARKWEAEGRSGAPARNKLQEKAKLAPWEADLIKTVAAEFRERVDALRAEAVVTAKQSAGSLSTVQISELNAQRLQLVESCLSRLRDPLGAARFQYVDAFVRATTKVQAVEVRQ
jgi:hypothetical protein